MTGEERWVKPLQDHLSSSQTHAEVLTVARLYGALAEHVLGLPANPLRDQALDWLRASGILAKESLVVYATDATPDA